MSTYFQILLFCIVIPFIFSFHKKIKYHAKWPEFIKSNILTIIPFIIWDEIFTKNGVWGFTKEHITGIYLFNLPIEEILFFIVIPFCCVFTYEVFNILSLKNNKYIQTLNLFIGVIVLIFGILSYPKMYTFITFISLGCLLIILYLKNEKFVPTFYLTFLAITSSFFLIVNGILTGGTLENPPVWYNNNENLNIRIWTIPIEDFFYSMLLLLSNIWLFEIFKRRSKIIVD